jgi:putative Ca2+/H+ antiporter (TMEM165/GDT1 family)
VTLLGTYGVSLGEALGLIIVTTPCVIAGVAVRRSMRDPESAAERPTRPTSE